MTHLNKNDFGYGQYLRKCDGCDFCKKEEGKRIAKELREWLERYAHTKGMNVKSWTEINDIRLQLDGEKVKE